MQSGEFFIPENSTLVIFNIIFILLCNLLLIIHKVTSHCNFFNAIVVLRERGKDSCSFNFMFLLGFHLWWIFKRNFRSRVFAARKLRNCIWRLIFFRYIHLLIQYVSKTRAHCALRRRQIILFLDSASDKQPHLVVFVVCMARPSWLHSGLCNRFVGFQIRILIVSRFLRLVSKNLIRLY